MSVSFPSAPVTSVAASATPPATWEDIADMDITFTPKSSSSLILMMASLTLKNDSGLDNTVDYQFAVAGTREGPLLTLSYNDNPGGEYMAGGIAWVTTGKTLNEKYSLQFQNRAGTAQQQSTTDKRSFFIIEFESGDANLLVNLAPSDAATSTGSYANITGSSGSATPAGTGSVLLFIGSGSNTMTDATDRGADHRFAVDGTREGPELQLAHSDNVDKGNFGCMIWANTGFTATSKTFSLQWKTRAGAPSTDTGRARVFQVLELLNATIRANVSSMAAGAAPVAYASVLDTDAAEHESTDTYDGDNIVVFLSNCALAGALDETATFTFAQGGTQEGGECTSSWADATDRVGMSGFGWAKENVSGSTVMSAQWKRETAAIAALDTARPSTFQTIDIAKGAAGALLVATTSASANVTPALTTEIILDAIVSASGAVLPVLTTEITLAATISASGAVIPSLTTEIRLAGVMAASGTLTPALTTEITLLSLVVGSGNAIADLTTAIEMATALTASGTVTPALTTEITVAGVLSGAGTVVANLTVGVKFDAVISASGTVVPDLTTQIPLDAILAGSGNITPDLTTEIRLAAIVSSSANVITDLTTEIRMAAVSAGSGSITADLSAGVQVDAVISASGTVVAGLTTEIQMAAVVSGSGTMSGSLTTEITLVVGLAASGTMSAALTTEITVTAQLVGSGTLSAALTTEITMAAIQQGSGNLIGDLTLDINFDSILSAAGTVAAALTTEILFEATVAASGIVVGDVLTEILLRGSLTGSGTVTADLLGVVITSLIERDAFFASTVSRDTLLNSTTDQDALFADTRERDGLF